jgi:tRNA modification GTPase
MSNISYKSESICAISSPQGVGGVALIRTSGDDALSIVNSIFSKSLLDIQGYSVLYGKILEKSIEIDHVIVTVFKNPNSFTGENVVEISCHGSVYIQYKILELLCENGARLALPGEFSKRAFFNGKLDLSQTEAIADLINSRSSAAHDIAIKQMRGGFSSELKTLRGKLIDFASLIELELDFSEEDVEFADRKKLYEFVDELVNHLNTLKNSFKLGNAIKNGVSTVIAGRPNAGKSTLLNNLLNEDRSIISSIAGTTRDTIEEILNINGIDFRLVDTAGIRKSTDEIEQIGVKKTLEKISTSSMVIYIYDCSIVSLEEVNEDLEKYFKKEIPCLVIANKIDLIDNLNNIPKKHFKTSLSMEVNMEDFKNEIYKLFTSQNTDYQGVIISNLRHYEALENANKELLKVKTGLDNNSSGDFLAMDIREALQHIGTITGEISSDELLGNIFANFCIGK